MLPSHPLFGVRHLQTFEEQVSFSYNDGVPTTPLQPKMDTNCASPYHDISTYSPRACQSWTGVPPGFSSLEHPHFFPGRRHRQHPACQRWETVNTADDGRRRWQDAGPFRLPRKHLQKSYGRSCFQAGDLQGRRRRQFRYRLVRDRRRKSKLVSGWRGSGGTSKPGGYCCLRLSCVHPGVPLNFLKSGIRIRKAGAGNPGGGGGKGRRGRACRTTAMVLYEPATGGIAVFRKAVKVMVHKMCARYHPSAPVMHDHEGSRVPTTS